MRFQVPQFIEIEDKIFGPLTIKQFVYVAGGVGLSFVAYRFLPFFLAIFIIAPALALGFALAFYKVNGRPLILAIENAFKYLFSKKLYIWKKQEKKIVPKEAKAEELEPLLTVPKLSDSKLKDLTWSLDIRETLNPVTREKR